MLVWHLRVPGIGVGLLQLRILILCVIRLDRLLSLWHGMKRGRVRGGSLNSDGNLCLRRTRNSSCSTQGVVVSEFRKRKKRIPVILLIVAKYLQVLLECLVCLFCLSISFGMISGSKVELHIKCFSERSEKSRNEFGSLV